MIPDSSEQQSKLLKIDSRGRVQRSREEQEAIIDAFEESALSGAEFARVHGLNYQTFCYWRTRRRKEEQAQLTTAQVKNDDFNFIEVASSGPTSPYGSLKVEIGSEIKIAIESPEQISLVAALIKELS